jgi:hypothetical protein
MPARTNAGTLISVTPPMQTVYDPHVMFWKIEAPFFVIASWQFSRKIFEDAEETDGLNQVILGADKKMSEQ